MSFEKRDCSIEMTLEDFRDYGQKGILKNVKNELEIIEYNGIKKYKSVFSLFISHNPLLRESYLYQYYSQPYSEVILTSG